MKLMRSQFRSDGIFSRLYNEHGVPIAYTLEHAYEQPDGTWAPKIPNGTFNCVRGEHQLHGMTQPFETFEITGVTGHVNLLFHAGNYDRDSEGCVLLGNAVVTQGDGTEMVVNSKLTFSEFMSNLNGVNEFMLTVEG
jgi:hypothetical protein